MYLVHLLAGLKHAKDFCNKIIKVCDITSQSYVVEIASNDGYLLKNFVKKNIPCLGIEPTDSTADKAQKIGVPVLRKFWKKLAQMLSKKKKKADLIIGNNVL